MSSIAFDEAAAAYDALHVALDKIAGLDLYSLPTAERAKLVERNESAQVRLSDTSRCDLL